MPGEGEMWFKTNNMKDIECRSYPNLEYQSIIWKKDIPKTYLEDKWQQLLKVIQVYITCEGRYGRFKLYHFRLINHFTGKNPLNMTHYLHMSLTKMAQKDQSKLEKENNKMFHLGLIKLIVLNKLHKREKT